MKNKEMRVNIDVSLDEIRRFYLANLNLMGKLLEAAKFLGDTLDVVEPICNGEEHTEGDEQDNSNEDWLKNLFRQSDESGCDDDEDYPEEDDAEDGEDDEDEAEALAITLLKAVFQALSETFDEYQ